MSDTSTIKAVHIYFVLLFFNMIDTSTVKAQNTSYKSVK